MKDEAKYRRGRTSGRLVSSAGRRYLSPMALQLQPLDESQISLLSDLLLQDDVWEFIGTVPLSALDKGNHGFAIMDGDVGLGFVGLFKSQAAGTDDLELLCATRTEAQHRGLAKQACQLVLEWAFDTARLPRVIACIDESNQPARAIASKLGMTVLGPAADQRIIYVKYRDEKARSA